MLLPTVPEVRVENKKEKYRKKVAFRIFARVYDGIGKIAF